MTTAYYIAAGFLAVGTLGPAILKFARPKARLFESGQKWTEDFSQRAIYGIAAAEAAAAIGLFVPPLTGIAPIVAPVAALGVVVLQTLAARAHARRHEQITPNVVLAVLAVAVATLGFLAFA